MRSLVGVVDVAFRHGHDGRIEGVVVLPATGAHERQVRLNVASGLMAGFGIALDPAKVELVRTSDELRAAEAVAAEVLAAATSNGAVAPAPVSPAHVAHVPNGHSAHLSNGNGAYAGHGPGAAPNGASVPQADPARRMRESRLPEGAVGLAARAFHALDEQNMRPTAPSAGPRADQGDGPPAPARAERAPVPPAPPRPQRTEEWEPELPPASAAPPVAPRRVRLLDDDGAPRDPSVRAFPTPATSPAGEPAVPPAARPAAAYVSGGRGGAAAALALPLEPVSPQPAPQTPAAPVAAPASVPVMAAGAAGVPKLEVAEVVAARGATFCRVVVEVDGERFTGVAETATPDLDRDPNLIELVARITVDALRSARVPSEPTQFHGASTVLVAGKPFVVAVLRAWNGRGFDDLCAVEPVIDSPEEAAALAVLKAAASRIA